MKRLESSRAVGVRPILTCNSAKPIRFPVLSITGDGVSAWTIMLQLTPIKEPAFPFLRSFVWLVTWQGQSGGGHAEVDASQGTMVSVVARSIDVVLTGSVVPQPDVPGAPVQPWGIDIAAEALATPEHIGHRLPTRTFTTRQLLKNTFEDVAIPPHARRVSVWSPVGMDMIAGGVTLETKQDSHALAPSHRTINLTEPEWLPILAAERLVRITNRQQYATSYVVAFEIGL